MSAITIASTYFERLSLGPALEQREEMKYEAARLKSYRGFEHLMKCSTIKLAKSGFYYSGVSDNVICFCCQKSKDNWRGNEDIQQEHAKLDPLCDFLNRRECGNVPILVPEIGQYQQIIQQFRQQIGQQERPVVPPNFGRLSTPEDGGDQRDTAHATPNDSIQNPLATANVHRDGGLLPSNGISENYMVSDSSAAPVQHSSSLPAGDPLPIVEEFLPYRSEEARLQTYHNWSEHAESLPHELARAGFIYTGNGDRVQCVFCRGILRNWDAGDMPMNEHRFHFPHCPFVRGENVGNVPIPVSQTRNQNQAHEQRQQITDVMLGIVTDRPRVPEYAIEASRLSTFENWPREKTQKPATLAKAGFFYAGFRDNVKCFYCEGGLRNWEAGDDPWVEHARWFPRCPYVRQVKGEAFIANVQRENATFSTASEHPGRNGNASEGTTVERREVISRLDRPIVQSILAMGFPRTKVIRVIEKRLQQTGDDFESAEALLDALFVEPDDPQDMVDTQTVASSGEASFGATQARDISVDESPTSDKSTKKQGKDSDNKNENSLTDMKGAVDAGTETLETRDDLEGDTHSLAEENRQLREQRLCKICMDDDVSVVFLPCGHLVCCASCAPALAKCPICRTHIRGTVRTYMS